MRLTIDPKENAHSLRIFNNPIFGKDNNTITIDCPSDTLEELRLRTAGSSDVDALVSFQRASIRTAGSSDVNLARVENLELNMAGSGDVDVETCSGASIRMAGSADACIHQIYGVLHVDLSGSGDFKVDQGEVSEFRCSLRGSGDVDARGLVVDDSEVVIRGSGDVVIGRGQVRGASLHEQHARDFAARLSPIETRRWCHPCLPAGNGTVGAFFSATDENAVFLAPNDLAASMALPPFFNMARPACDARGWVVQTMPRRA